MVVKINGRTGLLAHDEAFSVDPSFVEEAVRLGAVAIGYTMHYTSPREYEGLPQMARVRQECERFGLPLVVWADPGGDAARRSSRMDTSYALESAARMAMEMGATIVKSNVPQAASDDFIEDSRIPEYYRTLEKELRSCSETETLQIRCDRIVKAAQGIPILFSGGAEVSDEDLLYRADICIKAGCLGFIFGRNIWKREKSKALEITEKLRTLLHEAE